MKWPEIEAVCKSLETPEGYHIRAMSLCDVAVVTQKLREEYPDIQTGSESVHLKISHYIDNCKLAETEVEKDYLAVVFCKGSEIAGMMTMKKDPLAKTLLGTMGCVFKEHRGAGLGVMGNEFFLECARLLKAGLAYTFVTTTHPYEQLAIERAGFSPVGIVPAFDIDTINGVSEKRVFEVLYVKVLCDQSEISFPTTESLSPKCRELYSTLFSPR